MRAVQVRKNRLILTDHFVLETGKYKKMESEQNARMQRCIHLYIEMEKKDVIYRLVKVFYISFKTLEDAVCLGSCLDLGILPDWGCGAASSVSWDTAVAASLPRKPRALQWGRGFPWLG